MNNGLRFLGDVPILIDGSKVFNSSRIRLAGGEPRSLNYSIYTKQMGEKVPVAVEILFDFEICAGAGGFAARFAGMFFYLAMAFYFLAGGFLRAKNAWRASDRLKWKAILIFFATYWPLAFWMQLLKVAEAIANATGHCCFD